MAEGYPNGYLTTDIPTPTCKHCHQSLPPPPEPQLLDRTHCPFLELPLELRDKIYELLAADGLLSLHVTSQGKALAHSSHELSTTSKQTRMEFSATLLRTYRYASNYQWSSVNVRDFNFKRLMSIVKLMKPCKHGGFGCQTFLIRLSFGRSGNPDIATAENLGKWIRFINSINKGREGTTKAFRPFYKWRTTLDNGNEGWKSTYCLGCVLAGRRCKLWSDSCPCPEEMQGPG